MILLLMMIGCTPVTNYYITEVYEGPETEDVWAAGTAPQEDCTSQLEEIDVFEADGSTFYLQLLPDQVALMDERACSDGDDWYDYVMYELESEAEAEEQCPTYLDNAWVISHDKMLCATTGQIEVTTFGQSSWQAWENPVDGSLGIPNLRFDLAQFSHQELADGTSHLRLSNGQANSGLVRLDIAARIWRAMGYAAPRTSFVRVQTDMWDDLVGPDTWAGYTAFEAYKKSWVENQEYDITSIWEGVGDITWEDDMSSFECWWSKGDECEEDLLISIIEQVVEPHTDLMAETEGLVDWERMHQNLCLGNLTGTWDDWAHNTNNVVIALGSNGLVFLPYSIDISGGHPWYPKMWGGYWGWASLTQMCSQDSACREEAITTCFKMIDDFEAMDLTSIVTERCDALESAGLARAPDAEICEQVEAFYLAQPAILRDVLEQMLAGEYDTGWDTGNFDTW